VPVAGLPPRSRLDALADPDAFHWATGIENTVIVDPTRGGRTLDEYELTGHYEHRKEDLARVIDLRVDCVRYGVPWQLANPAPGRFDFALADDSFGRLLAGGVDPIVDLVHYGTPAWLERGFVDPDYPARVAEYAAALAERFRGRIRWYTPLNEPRITAWYCGRLGWWPPYGRGWSGFVAVMLGVCRGIRATARALLAVDPEIVLAHVDATDLYEPADPAASADAELRQRLVFLALDLLTGRVDSSHPLHAWLLRHGASPRELEEFLAAPLELDLVGINLYPMFTRKRVERIGRRLRIRMQYAGPDLLERLAHLYFDRYRRPLFVTETASTGRRRRAWLEGSVAAVRRLRAEGIPVVGYTWWPLFSLVAWAYRQGLRPREEYVLRMGLYELDLALGAGLARRTTPLVDAYRALASAGAAPVGRLAPAGEP
jgi:beta-glucosidase/6-phospho-beta-glucosidase/beta-galactosidase